MSSGINATMDEKLASKYASLRGYHTSTGSKSKESSDESKIADFILFYNENEANNPKAYESSYSSLRNWIDQSIDVYQFELRRVLFPLFVHSYLDLISKGLKSHGQHFLETFKNDHIEYFGNDISRLTGITEPGQIAENELAQNYRNHKYAIKMSQYSFELLLCFLQDNKFMLLLRILNQYVSIQATREKPGTKKEDSAQGLDEDAGLVDVPSVDSFNEQSIKLGRLPPDIPFLSNVIKVLEKEYPDDAELKNLVQQQIDAQVEEDAPSRDGVPQEPKRMIDIEAEIEFIKEARTMLKLSPEALPSICCYTFMNTSNSIHDLKASRNGDMVVSGSCDSIVRLWDTSRAQTSGARPTPHNLIGHSGSVFGLDISPDSQYILSASEDRTARLWSVETKKSLVVYRGHNYPIFDVAFGPHGFYFATASHDRTARLWSCDHVFPLRLFVGHVSDVECVTFHPNSNYILTGSADMTARLWDIQRGACVRIFTRHLGSILSVAISPDGRTMATGGEDHSIKLWDLGSGKKIKTFSGHIGPVYSLAFSRDGSLLASGAGDDSVRIWDAKTADASALEVLHGADGTSSTGHVTRPHSAGGVSAGVVPMTVDTPNQRSALLGTYPTKRTPIYSVQFSPKNLLFALGVFQP